VDVEKGSCSSFRLASGEKVAPRRSARELFDLEGGTERKGRSATSHGELPPREQLKKKISTPGEGRGQTTILW